MAEGEYRNLTNQEYWKKRSEEKSDKYWNKIKNVEKEVAKQYRLALDDIRQMTIDLFEKYSTEQRITYQEAVKQLTTYEMGDYQTKIDKLVAGIRETNDPMLIAEITKLRTVSSLSRFQALMAQIEARLLDLGYSQQMTMEEWLSGIYENNYYETIYALQTGTGLGFSFVLLNDEAVKTAITTPLKGDMFSSRIWDNKDLLVKELRQTITEGLIKGESNQKMARNLRDKMNSNYSNALRLVRTETTKVLSDSQFNAYQESDLISQYVYLARLSEKTCEICGSLDRQVFKLSEKEIGKNCPPMHPNCRCDFHIELTEEELANSERRAKLDGKSFLVPATMTFDEFKDKYIQKSVPEL